jgi:flagellar basal-body rod protein FlgF
MDRLLYVSMNGASKVMDAQAANANNIANISTPGYKAIEHNAMTQRVEGDGLPTRHNSFTDASGVNFAPGTLMATGRDLDVAIQGSGWLVVQGVDGDEALTRRGDLQLDSTGLLTTGDGHPVMGDGGPIAVPPNAKVTIGVDGTISVVPMGQGPEVQAEVARIRLVDASEVALRRGEDGLFRTADGVMPPDSANVRLITGHLEGSNVNTAEAMVQMIELSRQFELQVRMMRTAEENDSKAAELLRMS